MNYLDILAKIIKFNSKKQKKDNLKSNVVLAVAGVAIVGVAVAFFTKGCCEQIKNVVIKNLEDSDEDIQEDINEDINEETNIIRDEIKETLGKVGDKSIGDVGVAIEEALEDLEEEEESENEVKS